MVSAGGAALLSFLLPGFGQVALGDATKGILFFIFGILVMLMLWYLLGIRIAYIGGFFYGLAAAYDALVSAR